MFVFVLFDAEIFKFSTITYLFFENLTKLSLYFENILSMPQLISGGIYLLEITSASSMTIFDQPVDEQGVEGVNVCTRILRRNST